MLNTISLVQDLNSRRCVHFPTTITTTPRAPPNHTSIGSHILNTLKKDYSALVCSLVDLKNVTHLELVDLTTTAVSFAITRFLFKNIQLLLTYIMYIHIRIHNSICLCNSRVVNENDQYLRDVSAVWKNLERNVLSHIRSRYLNYFSLT